MTSYQKLFVISFLLLFVSFGSVPSYAQDSESTRISSGDSPPWAGKTLPHGGFVNHLIAEAFKLEGYTVQFVHYP